MRLLSGIDHSSGGLRDWLHRRAIFPGIVRLLGAGELFRYKAAMEHAQFQRPDLVAAQQMRKLAETLDFARRFTPRYARSLAAAVEITPENALEVLKTVPIIARRDLQEDPDDVVARPQPRRVTRKTTSGSTGESVTLLKDHRALGREMAASWLAYGWFGVRMGDRCALFWGSPTTARRRVRSAAADFAMNRTRLTAFGFDDVTLEQHWRKCLRFRPRYLYGYVSMLHAFARFLAERGYDGHLLPLRSVVATAEVLSGPQRRLLEEVFGVPVQNEYGCGEVGPIAYECPAGSLHIMSDNLFVEILDHDDHPAQPGTPGSVVVTDLNNRATALVRYRLGDHATLGDACSCGRGFPVLAKVWGRAYDFVQTPDGKRYHGEFFMYCFEDLRERGVPVRQFQIVQVSPDTIHVYLVLPDAGRDGFVRKVEAELKRRLPTMTMRPAVVQQIKPLHSGKSQVVRGLSAASVS